MNDFLSLSWSRDQHGVWHTLDAFDISNVQGRGVYIIWNNLSGRVIKVGQGDIHSRLSAHRTDEQITKFQGFGQGVLLVTWATLGPLAQVHLDRIERFLGDELRPLVGTYFPNADPLPVNLPLF